MARSKVAKWSNEELVTKAHQARLFKEPLVEEFFDRTEDKLFNEWRASPADAPQKREELYLQCLGIQAFRKFIEETIILGKMAESEIVAKQQKEMKGH